MAMENLAPGYRFYPTEEELVDFYLRHKLEGSMLQAIHRVIKTIDVYNFNPWDLPQLSSEASFGDPEQWFFFIPKQESEIRGDRPRRLTALGYWKATGSPACVYSNINNHVIGVKRTMVFYTGRAPNGTKTEWKMNEYKLVDTEFTSLDLPSRLRDEYSLCRVYKKSKCSRTFDRRPTMDHLRSQSDQQNMNVSSSSNSAMVVERAANGSPDNSNSTSFSDNDDRQAPVVGRNIDPQISSSSVVLSSDDNDSLWDWEQLQWF